MDPERERLWTLVQNTQREHIKAIAAFDAAILDSANTTVNGLLAIVAQERRVAFEHYVKALGDFSRYLNHDSKPG